MLFKGKIIFEKRQIMSKNRLKNSFKSSFGEIKVGKCGIHFFESKVWQAVGFVKFLKIHPLVFEFGSRASRPYVGTPRWRPLAFAPLPLPQ
ncbi:hypothetical protein [Haemophilus paracuniculus]|uniref:hypothetical protein n=1 Tax=Haemophilus paracuniculus TaxID=734 RepID=UPI00117AB4E4|nr:hypothetical protein [Haemophilus paracuniculus]